MGGIYMENEITILQYRVTGKNTELNPALKSMPEWYRQIPRESKNGDQTVKHCMPFLDAMTAGYLLSLQEDLEVRIIDGNTRMLYDTDLKNPFIEVRGDDATDPMPPPHGYNPKHFTWTISTEVKPPEGYSLLLCHPINRIELPFFTLTGFVDNELMNGRIPFYIRENFEGIIPAGTPIIQIIPIKRTNWVSEEVVDLKLSYDHPHSETQYRDNRWSKKSYK